MKKYKLNIIISLCSIVFSDTKIGYIDSQIIMSEYEDVKQVQVELEKEQKKHEALYKKNIASYDSLNQAIQTGSIIFSEEKKNQAERH